jgi:ankyrin repeat protein
MEARVAVNQAANYRPTPLHLLQLAKAKVNQARADGLTPLYSATEFGNVKVVRILLGAGSVVIQVREKFYKPTLSWPCV